MISSSLDTSQNRMDPTFRTVRLLANTGAFGAPQKTNTFVGVLTFVLLNILAGYIWFYRSEIKHQKIRFDVLKM